MRGSLFSENNPVIHCAPKRPKRRWGRMLLIISLAVLAVWLLSGCHTTQETSPKVHGVIIGLGMFAFVLFVYFAERKARQWDEHGILNHLKKPSLTNATGFELAHEEIEAPWRLRRQQQRREFWKNAGWLHDVPVWSVGPLESLGEPDTAATQHGPTDEMEAELRWSEAGKSARAPLQPEDLREIVGALLVTCCESRDLVRKAQGNLAVDDYGDKLAGAESRLTQAIECLGGVLESCSSDDRVRTIYGTDGKSYELRWPSPSQAPAKAPASNASRSDAGRGTTNPGGVA